MLRIPLRQTAPVAALLAIVLAAAVLLAPPPAAAQADDPAVEPAVGWLLERLDAGDVDSRGVLADAIFALRGVEAGDEAVGTARAELEAQMAEYVAAGGRDPGQLAKAVLAIAAAGGDPADVAGTDLVALLRDSEQADGGDAGRFGSGSLFVQSLAIMALRTTADGPSAAAVDWLVARACPGGGYPVVPGPADASGASTGCDDPAQVDLDATAVAVQALDGIRDPEAAAGAAVLRDAQEADGSVLANSNTTGLAAQALRAVGDVAAADRAAGFVSSLQIPAGQPDAGAFRYRADDDGSLLLSTTQGLLAFGAPAFHELGAAAPDVEGEACAPGTGVTVVVDLTDFDAGVHQGCAPGDPTSGLDALAAAGFDVITEDTDFGPYVCAIEGFPELACDQPFEGSFWAYFGGGADGAWEASDVGAAATDPAPGDVEGWRYSDGAPPTVPAPPTTTPGPVRRLAGPDRLSTAVAISRDAFADDTAGAVVLARADAFADALAGAPLAGALDGPLLITPSDALPAVVADEVDRVLPAGGRVVVLGGPAAVGDDVVATLRSAGYAVERIAGADRVTTAIAVAEALGQPERLLITTGDDFPDALAAGAAAAAVGDAAVLLTPSGRPSADLDRYLEDRPDAQVTAIGGPAATAYPDAEAIAGTGRVETAIAVAEAFAPDGPVVAVARADDPADALAGGPRIAALGGPLLLTATDQLPPALAAHLCDRPALEEVLVLGGTSAVADPVVDALADLVAGGCA